LLDAALNGQTRRAMRKRQNRPRKDGTFKPIVLPPIIAVRLKREGRLRALAYRLMIESGLRLNEARELIWSDVDLAAGIMRLRAETTKNGLAAELPIGPGLLAELLEYKNDEKPSDAEHVAANLQTDRARRQLDEDLKAAGIEKRDASGRTVDFHALRHTFGTRLVAGGADIKSVQALMRHATPTITMAIYVHSDRTRMTSALACMPTIRTAEKNGPEIQTSAS
jgi:integrase